MITAPAVIGSVHICESNYLIPVTLNRPTAAPRQVPPRAGWSAPFATPLLSSISSKPRSLLCVLRELQTQRILTTILYFYFQRKAIIQFLFSVNSRNTASYACQWCRPLSRTVCRRSSYRMQLLQCRTDRFKPKLKILHSSSFFLALLETDKSSACSRLAADRVTKEKRLDNYCHL